MCKGRMTAEAGCGTVAAAMGQRPTSASDDTLVRLCRTAEMRAASLEHELGPWDEVEEVARRATCVRCGRAVYVRAEGSLSGIAGRACGERCDA
jgi:hypothetical protein